MLILSPSPNVILERESITQDPFEQQNYQWESSRRTFSVPGVLDKLDFFIARASQALAHEQELDSGREETREKVPVKRVFL